MSSCTDMLSDDSVPRCVVGCSDCGQDVSSRSVTNVSSSDVPATLAAKNGGAPQV